METNDTKFTQLTRAHKTIDQVHEAYHAIGERQIGVERSIAYLTQHATELFLAGKTEEGVVIRDSIGAMRMQLLSIELGGEEKATRATRDETVREQNDLINRLLDINRAPTYTDAYAVLLMDHLVRTVGVIGTTKLLEAQKALPEVPSQSSSRSWSTTAIPSAI